MLGNIGLCRKRLVNLCSIFKCYSRVVVIHLNRVSQLKQIHHKENYYPQIHPNIRILTSGRGYYNAYERITKNYQAVIINQLYISYQ